MAAHPVHVLLLLRADNPEHADRAWGRMASWSPGDAPSVVDDQVNQALRLTKDGADPVELCKYDDVLLERVAKEKAEAESLEKFKERYRRRAR